MAPKKKSNKKNAEIQETNDHEISTDLNLSAEEIKEDLKDDVAKTKYVVSV